MMNVDFFTMSVVSIEFVSFSVGLWVLKKWADKRYNALQQEFRAFHSYADGRINTLLNENAALQKEVDRHTREVDRHTEENAALQKEVDRHTEENAALQKEVDRHTREVDRHTEENAALQKEVDRHTEENAALRKEFKAFQSQADRRFNVLAKENESLRKAVDGYIEENAALQKAIKKHTAEIEELRQQNRELQTGFDTMSGRYAELKEQLFPMLEQILDRLSQR